MVVDLELLSFFLICGFVSRVCFSAMFLFVHVRRYSFCVR